MGTKKGGRRKGAKLAGSRLAYDDTPSKKRKLSESERNKKKFKKTGRSGGISPKGNYGSGPKAGWGKSINYTQRIDEAILKILDFDQVIKAKGGNIAEIIEKLIMRKYGETSSQEVYGDDDE